MLEISGPLSYMAVYSGLLIILFSDYMDRTSDCGIDVQNVNRNQVITIHAKSADTMSSQGSCSIHFRALDSDAKLQLEFITFSMTCGVSLYLAGGSVGSIGSVSKECYFSDVFMKTYVYMWVLNRHTSPR